MGRQGEGSELQKVVRLEAEGKERVAKMGQREGWVELGRS